VQRTWQARKAHSSFNFGIAKPTKLEGKRNGFISDQRSQKLKAGLKLTAMFNRQHFNVGVNRAPIGDEVEMTVDLEMAQQ
jgi:polyisoprenoid-binding protein YceI